VPYQPDGACPSAFVGSALGWTGWIAGRQLEEWQKEFEPFDQALVFTPRWKPSLIPWMAGIDRRSGTLGRFRFMLINDARWMPVGKFPTRRSRYLALADDHGEMSDEPLEPQLFSDLDNARALSKEYHLNPERPAMVFCPGGDLRSGQRWPVERWTKLERQMDVSNLSGRLAWDDKLDLLAQSRAVLAQETLYSQLCRALNHPLVMLRGSGELDVVIPEDHDQQGNQSTPQRAQVKTVGSDRTCQPCHDLVCRQHKNKATDPCIHDLSVERVRSALLSMVPMQAVD